MIKHCCLCLLFVLVLLMAACRPQNIPEDKQTSETETSDPPSIPTQEEPSVENVSFSYVCDFTENIAYTASSPWDTVKFGVCVGDNVDSVCQILDCRKNVYLVLELADTITDDSHHYLPACWMDVPVGQPLADSVFAYTLRTLRQFEKNHVQVQYVQLSRCISNGIFWRTNEDILLPAKEMANNAEGWRNFALYLNAAACAVREVFPQAKIVLQTDRFGTSESIHLQLQNLLIYWAKLGVDYDVLSMYYNPFERGSLNNVKSSLDEFDFELIETKSLHFETFYPCSAVPDGMGLAWDKIGYLYTSAGQKQYLQAVRDLLRSVVPRKSITLIYRYAGMDGYLGLYNYRYLKDE